MGGGGRGARATNTAVRKHTTGLVCSNAAAEVQVPERDASRFEVFFKIYIYVYINWMVNCTSSCRTSGTQGSADTGTGDPLQPHNSSTEGAQPLRIGGVQTAECYGLHCLFKSMLGGLCSFAKEGWQGSKASEAKAAKKVLKTELSL